MTSSVLAGVESKKKIEQGKIRAIRCGRDFDPSAKNEVNLGEAEMLV